MTDQVDAEKLNLAGQEAEHEPCTACSFTRYQQRTCSYESQLRLLYGVSHRGVWSIGSQYFLKDQKNHPPDYDPQNTRFLQGCTTIPVAQTILEWEEPGDRVLRMTKAIEGITLQAAWPNLSETEKRDIAKQTWSYLAQLRTLHSDQIENVEHGPMYCDYLFAGGPGTPHSLKSDEELFDAMAGGIKELPDNIREAIRSGMPVSTPYTFTHGELSSGNIIIKDGKVAGILDWEGSGYMPRWWEWVCTFHYETADDGAWKKLLRECMEEYGYKEGDAYWYWRNCFFLREYPKLREEGKERLAVIKKDMGLEEADLGEE